MCNEAWTLLGLCCISIGCNIWSLIELHKREETIHSLREKLKRAPELIVTIYGEFTK